VVVAAVLALSLSGYLCAARGALAQGEMKSPVERQVPVSAEKRADLYRQLRAQAKILEAQAAVVKTVVKLIGPTVVHIEADTIQRTALQYGRSRQMEDSGTGVVVRLGDKHYVLTNRHLVREASPDQIRIYLVDGRMIHPQKVWDDERTDVAVMAVYAPDLVDAPIGDSDSMEIGDFVLAVGSPFGLRFSFSHGIVSAKGRRGLELGRERTAVTLQDFIQTDATVNPGNSGGPLINLRGEVVGINTAIASNSGGSEGVAFAIPINMFMHVARQLVEHDGEVRWAYLGVTLDRNFDAEKAIELGLPRLMGARVLQVRENSPAARAQLEKGDIILQIDDVSIEDDNHLVNVVNMTEVGKEVSLLVYRNGKRFRTKTTLADLKDFSETPS
jgi:serine protease Do